MVAIDWLANTAIKDIKRKDSPMTEMVERNTCGWCGEQTNARCPACGKSGYVENNQQQRDIERLKAEIERLQSEGWQDISTAPRDGTQFLGYSRHHVMGVIACIHGEWVYQADGQCAIEYQDDRATNYFTMYAPTHWRPLPQPPEEDQTDDR